MVYCAQMLVTEVRVLRHPFKRACGRRNTDLVDRTTALPICVQGSRAQAELLQVGAWCLTDSWIVEDDGEHGLR